MRAIGFNHVPADTSHMATSLRFREILFSIRRASVRDVGFAGARAAARRSKRPYGPW
jgi:hypothetical protein